MKTPLFRTPLFGALRSFLSTHNKIAWPILMLIVFMVRGEANDVPQRMSDQMVRIYQFALETEVKQIPLDDGLRNFTWISNYWNSTDHRSDFLAAEWYRSYFEQLQSPSEANSQKFIRAIEEYAMHYHSDEEWNRMINAIACWFKVKALKPETKLVLEKLISSRAQWFMGNRIFDIYYHLAMTNYYLPNYPSAIRNFKIVLNNRNKITPGLYKNACVYLGWSYRYHGKYDSALIYLDEFQSIVTKEGDEKEKFQGPMYRANIYELQGRYYKALSTYLDVLEKERKSDLHDQTAWTLNAIGNVYLKLGDLIEAEKYLLEGLALYRNLNIDHGIATSERDLGKLYLKKGDLEEALNSQLRALEIRKKRNRHGLAESYNAIAHIYMLRGEYESAFHYLRLSLERSRKSGMRKDEQRALLYFAELLPYLPPEERKLKLQSFDIGTVDALMAEIEEINHELSVPENYPESLQLLSRYYESKGDKGKALLMMKNFTSYKDSLFNARQLIEIQDLKNKHLLASKQEEIHRLQFDQQKQELELERQKSLSQKTQMMWAGGLLLLLGGFLFFIQRIRYKQKRKDALQKMERAKQEEMEKHKDEFFANMTHEFRTPLTLIEAPLQTLLEKAKEHKIQAELLRIIERNAKRLKRLSYQILEGNRIKSGDIPIETKMINLSALIRALYTDFLPLAKREMITLEMDLPDRDIMAYLDGDLIEEVLLNLLSNAIKFTKPGKTVRMLLHYSESGPSVEICDEGPGMSEEVSKHIFKRYFTINHSSRNYNEGTGLGLPIAKAYVEAHGGTIEVKSRPEEGACMKVLLPVNYYFLPEKREKLPEIIPETTEPPETLNKNEKTHTILLVEDNADLRYFIKNSVLCDYDVILARNGHEGVDMAKELIPDLIISDIMMPDMDGLEMLDILKDLDVTDHIPFIFLTAKATPGNKLEGIKRGADAYVEKPFSADELRYRVQNTLRKNEILKEKYQSGIREGNEVEVHPYLRKVKEILSQHLDKSEYNVNELCSLLNISRSQFHRKIKSLTGVAPSRFIRDFRLNKARDLLLAGESNIAGVAYQTGFTSPGYFSKCFKELFGLSPSELLATSG